MDFQRLAEFRRDITLWHARHSYGRKQRQYFYKNLTSLITNGLSLNQALTTLWKSASKDGTKPQMPEAIIIDHWQRKIRGGSSLGEAMRGWIPPAEQNVIEANVDGGQLARGLMEAARLSDSMGAIVWTLVGSIINPVIILLTLAGVLYSISSSVIPNFAQSKPPETWTGLARYMYIEANFAVNYTLPIICGLFLFFIVYAYTVKKWTGKLRRYADRIPPWSFYRIKEGAAFLYALAALLRSKVPLTIALMKIRETATPYLRERIDEYIKGVRRGNPNIGAVMKQSGFRFPDDDVIRNIEVAGNLSGVADALTRFADEFQADALQLVKGQAFILNIIALFFSAACVGVLAMGLVSLTTQIADEARNSTSY